MAPPITMHTSTEPLSGPSLLEFLIPDMQAELLAALLDDASVSHAVSAAAHAFLPRAIPAYVAVKQQRMRALSRALHPDAKREQRAISVNDHPRAMRPFLSDVRRLAALPNVPAKCAYELLASVARGSLPAAANDRGNPRSRAVFDAEADQMMLVLAIRRKDEEGERFSVGEAVGELKEMERKLAAVLETRTWFPHTLALLESWSAECRDPADVRA